MGKIRQKFLDTIDKRRFFFSIISSLMIVLVLIFSLLCLQSILKDEEMTLLNTFLALTFLALAFARIPLAISAIVDKTSKIRIWKNLVFAFIYFVIFILYLAIPKDIRVYCAVCGIYLMTVAANRVCIIFESNRLGTKIFNGILAVISIFVAIPVFSGQNEDVGIYLIICLGIIMVVSIIEIMAYSFSRMQLKGILKIMHKTYAFEVLYGLFVLIISFSVYFMIMESSIPTYGDALWYSFAVVTTIGFGDFTVTSTISRILSVILGMYGIVVVAIITSVIVNFYNESKDNKKEDPKEIEEKKENEDK